MTDSEHPILPGFPPQQLEALQNRYAAGQLQGPAVSLESLLAEVPAEHQREVFEVLLLDDLALQAGLGKAVRLADYLTRFPNYSREIEAAFREAESPAPRLPPTEDRRDDRPVRGDSPKAAAPPSGPAKASQVPPGGATRNPPPTLISSGNAAPALIGDFEVLRRLGHGGFGDVYLARDSTLRRLVAIKVPNERALRRMGETWIREARIAAQLDHPHIVTVYHVGSAPEFPAFIVTRYIDGITLAERMAQSPVPLAEAVELVITVAEALDYAHRALPGMVHRDIKPSNLLLNHQGRVHVADFGLAIQEADDPLELGVAGTPPYMSPEQIRGEEHRIDRRSDIYSLGVVLYELLTGRRPFRAKERVELEYEITRQDPKPPRRLNSRIPQELERICLKALAKLVSERYSTARELAEDLRAFQASHPTECRTEEDTPNPPAHPASPPTPVTPIPPGGVTPPSSQTPGSTPSDRASSRSPPIVPKGLRAFDAGDAGFFLQMLPGPRDRDGLPDSLRFWKRRIEQSDDQPPFLVGVLTGPSGCGKSSFIRAGLIPLLGREVLPIYVEATADRTERQLRASLQRQLPRLEQLTSLPQLLGAISRGEAGLGQRKLLLVIDQFEQWLQAHEGQEQDLLASALRQCDGERLQALLLVRDDFSLGVHRFLRWLDISLVQGWNHAVLDRFGLDHARQVLTAFGTAFGKLPAEPSDLTVSQREFVTRATEGLAERHLVAPVRLALFAEMFRNRPWTPEALIGVGGAEGVGRVFLDETFRSDGAPPQYRLHAPAAQRVLAALLPEVGSEIKGHRQPLSKLIEVAGYTHRPDDAEELLRVLDTDLHLISPVVDSIASVEEPASARPDGPVTEGVAEGRAGGGPAETHYHLTHDYLVPSLRKWIESTVGETPAGRARLLLREQSRLWNDRPRNRYLPTLGEYAQLLRWTSAKDRTEPERKMLARATRVHGQRLGMAALVLLLALLAGLWFQARSQASSQVEQLATSQPTEWNRLVAQLNQSRGRSTARDLVNAHLRTVTNPTDAVPLRLAQLRLAPDQADLSALHEVLLSGPLDQFLPVREQLRPQAVAVVPPLWTALRDESLDGPRRLRAAMALAGLAAAAMEAGVTDQSPTAPTAPTWTPADVAFVTEQLVASNVETQPVLREALRPIHALLDADLERLFVTETASPLVRLAAAHAVADFSHSDVNRMVRLLNRANPEQYAILYARLPDEMADATLADLARLAATPPPKTLGSAERLHWGRQRANAAVTLLRRGQVRGALRALEVTDDPEALTQFIFRCRSEGVVLEQLLACLDEVATAGNDRYAPPARYAVLLALGEFPLAQVPQERVGALVDQLGAWYAGDPSSCVHAATGWLLRQWGQQSLADRVDWTPVPYVPDREWFTEVLEVRPTLPAAETSPPHDSPPATRKWPLTFHVSVPGTYTIGSPLDEPDRRPKEEHLREIQITHPFAVLERELTMQELIDFNPEFEAARQSYPSELSQAAHSVDWYDAVACVRWMSQQTQLGESAQAYPDPSRLNPGEYPRETDPKQDWAPRNWPLRLDRPGFRLPTESEWEVACRGPFRTRYPHGGDLSLVGRFGWTGENSQRRHHIPRELRPTLRGLYDSQGNVLEWTHDWFAEQPSEVINPSGPLTGDDRTLRGGSGIHGAIYCRAASRYGSSPADASYLTGLRPARSLVPMPPDRE